MARTITDDNFLEWEVYVSGGQPDSKEAARIFFYCLDAPMNPARFVRHESGNVATAEADLLKMSDERLRELLSDAIINE
ncbi:MAG: hypothetical protein Q8W45_03220 [Candidatus Palauibacterales bacterium]|jgi:vancomycin resistance protein YoaR|nr:hypothetical protein [Candidatus Palauibacterales bacterium]MDP2482270.1 hypothetical protein [Candidatus Palauibacterales bacterium]